MADKKAQQKEELKDMPVAAHINPVVIEDEMKTSYLNYAMSVIVGRALPDVRDGLKPVHRRILYSMHESGFLSNRPYKKSARIVGDVLGRYHPHGDSAVYQSMVRMAQPFSLRYTLIDGQGNFGSVDGDSAAAMRYTEARLSKLAELMLEDIEKETVDFTPNFDGSLKEPLVLPSKLPNLLINGSSGIAVGMATNIPPHNLKEICQGLILLIDRPDAELKEIMELVQGPDFPTGGIIAGMHGILEAYSTGRGRIKVKGKAEIEEKAGRARIIITEIPYMINKSVMIEEIADSVNEKIIEGISDIRDESDRTGMRVVIELKKDAAADVVLNQLMKHSKLQVTFGITLLALVDNEPKVLTLKEFMQHYLEHRKVVVTRKTQFDLQKAKEKAHVLKGLVIALDDIDRAIALIKASKSTKEAQAALMKNFPLDEIQANAILDMKLQKLTGLEQEKLRQEYQELLKLITKLQEILSDVKHIYAIIRQELKEVMEKYSDRRMTEISADADEDIEVEDLIAPEDCVVTISHQGYIKRTSVDSYRIQKRGGTGILASATKDEDFIEDLFVAHTHSYMLFLTNLGKVHWLKVYEIPSFSRQSKGKAIVNLIRLGEGEKVTAFIPIDKFDDHHYLLMATKKGLVKKTVLSAYARPREGGIRAIMLEAGDQLIDVKKTDGTNQILIATASGQAVRFNETDARPIGRTSKGVTGIRFKGKDEVIGMVIAHDNETLFTITETGYGKRTEISDYRLINRGGTGVINIQTTERNGKVVAIKSVTDEDELMVISKNGIIIRMAAKDISVIGRNTQGMRLMKMREGDVVVSAAKVVLTENGVD